MQAKGRPTKFSGGDRYRGKDAAPAWVQERTGVILNHGPGAAEYTVVFDDHPNTISFVQSNWIEPVEQPESVQAGT